MPDFFKGSCSGVGCGRAAHGFAAIAQAADVLVDLMHDVQLHLLADCAALGTHEQSVFNQTAKLRAFLAYNANDLIFKKKVRIGGIFHIRGDSDIFHLLTFLDDNYGGGVGGVVRPCPLFFQDGEKYVPDDSFRHMKQLLTYEQFIYILSR